MNLVEALGEVITEHDRSVLLHGDWQHYDLEQMMSVIINELMMEAGDAVARGDLHGEHGVIAELKQVASCCLKAMVQLSERTEAV
jgi:hypothetical protein